MRGAAPIGRHSEALDIKGQIRLDQTRKLQIAFVCHWLCYFLCHCTVSELYPSTMTHTDLYKEDLMDTLLSIEEAARRLGGLSKWTIHAWLAKGKLRRTKVGSRTMIRESELARVIRDESTSAVRS